MFDNCKECGAAITRDDPGYGIANGETIVAHFHFRCRDGGELGESDESRLRRMTQLVHSLRRKADRYGALREKYITRRGELARVRAALKEIARWNPTGHQAKLAADALATN